MKLTLVVLAAGMGSRYGGLKQVDPVGPNGEILLEYSVFDALKAGFERLVCVIRPDTQDAFDEHIASRVKGKLPIEYAYQRLEDLPAGFSLPAERKKPWGTGHAILACQKLVDGPFLSINADDYYGPQSYQLLAEQLRHGGSDHAMAGFRLKNTLSEHGSVSRGICETDEEGWLRQVVEHTDISPEAVSTLGGETHRLTGNEVVSMNFWGLQPSIFQEIHQQFVEFLSSQPGAKGELYIPSVLDRVIKEGRGRVKVLASPESWFGVTYPDDKPRVVEQIRAKIAQGQYPEKLWT